MVGGVWPRGVSACRGGLPVRVVCLSGGVCLSRDGCLGGVCLGVGWGVGVPAWGDVCLDGGVSAWIGVV